MRFATINANEAFSRLGFPEENGTLVSSRIFSRSDETPADPYLGMEVSSRNILDTWKHVIAEILEGLVRRHVQEYMDRYLETAEESPRFYYIPDVITTATVERAKRIRDATFAQKEKFVAYTPEELKSLF